MKDQAPEQKRILITTAACLFGLFFVVGLGNLTFALESFYSTRMSPGVMVAGQDVSGFTKETVTSLLQRYIDTLQKNGIQISYKDMHATLYPHPIPLNPDIPSDAIPPLGDVDIDQTVRLAFAIGHNGDTLIKNNVRRLNGLFSKTEITPIILLDKKALTASLQKDFGLFEKPSVDPGYIFKNGETSIKQSSPGTVFDYERIAASIESDMRNLKFPNLTLELHDVSPSLSDQDARTLIPQVAELLAKAPFEVTADTRSFQLSKKQMAGLLIPQKRTDGELEIAFNRDRVINFLKETVADAIFVKTERSRFKMVNGNIVPFQMPEQGRELDLEASADMFIESILEGTETSIPLVVNESENSLTIDTDALRITEIVASAQTNYTGSPQNRKKNIQVGISRINGLLIAPDEEFSLIGALGPIEKENGFLPELVIKGNKTTPEYGGGLCQVSTTLFRAVAHAGLPVLERRNHSYRVSYYEPPVGFDATIYFPKPDFRFKNDTGSHILIEARTEGTKAHIVLWGTKDGRNVEVDTPTVYNIKKAPPTKLIETSNLKPGVKKCTEKAHNGADAVFERRVTYPNGELKKDTFKSHYVVWPAVCLVGKKDDSPLLQENQSAASSTTQSLPSSPVPSSSTPELSL